MPSFREPSLRPSLLRRASILRAAGLVCLSLAVSSCSADSGDSPSTKGTDVRDGSQTTPQTAEALNLTDNSEVALAGELVTSAGTARFDSQLDAMGSAVSVLVLGDQTIEWLYDSQLDRLTVDGRGAVLSAESVGVFASLRDQLYSALDAEGSAKGRLPTHKAVLAAEVAWLAAGQPGTLIDTFSNGLPAPAGTGGDVPYASFGNDGVTCLRKGVSTRYWARSDGGHSISSNFTVNSTQSCSGSVKGCSNWNGACMGQCGSGCQSIWKNGSFQDCFDHDFCTYYFTDCSRQFRDAADDYAASLLDRCN